MIGVITSTMLTSLIALLVSTLLGVAIGAEREWRRHPGGLRSCILVAAVACLRTR